MKKIPTINELKRDLKPLSAREVVVFGSLVEGGFRPESDIDVAVITRSDDRDHNIRVFEGILGLVPERYDVKVFELLPVHVRMAIVLNYIVIYGNRLEISEYFYKTRKEWDDCKFRILENQYSSFQERLDALHRRKKILTR
ncbi:MAG: nucleotidyltransferase domain-containing protein [Promethearchaeota archaeon]